jgi:hypothetical protein
MKTRLFIFIVLIVGCTTKNPQKNITGFKDKETVSQRTLTDTIKTFAGFHIGMTEKEIRDYVISNPRKFFVNKKYLLRMLRTKIDNINYMIDFDLYKGKLNKISFSIDKGWDKIDDIKFKEHYNKIYSILKELNKYNSLENDYYNKFNVEWPFSCGSKYIVMATFHIDDDYFYNHFTIYLGQDEENFTYYLNIVYSGADIKDYESSLSKTLYFDEL